MLRGSRHTVENKYGQVIQKICIGQLYRKRDHNGMERNDSFKGKEQIQKRFQAFQGYAQFHMQP